MDLVGPIIEMLNCLMPPVCRHLEHYRNLQENMEELRRVLGDLKNRLEDINLRKQNAEACPRKVVRREVMSWLEKVQIVNNDIQAIEQKFQNVSCLSRGSLGKHVQKKIKEVKELILQQGSFPDDIAIDQPPSSGMRLPTEDARGRTSVKEQIWGYLIGDVVGMIGVCGPGGIGKTTFMKNIHNDLLNESKFDKVIWASVPYPVSVVKLQDNIASNMKQALPENVTEEQRAATLSEILSKVRYVLILDDAWGRFSFEDVGIPKPTQQNGCKVVITSRLVELCNYVGCEQVIRMQQLSKEESLNLFLDTVGHDVMKIPNLEETLKLVVEECAGLPLAIVVIARSMRGENDISTWRYALFELRSRVKRVKGWDDEIFQRLKFSYDRLNDLELQNCFLDCSLYPKDGSIQRYFLIESWIDNGLIEQLETRRLMHDRANVILNSLVNKCLIERVEHYSDYSIRMHDVIREMALQVAGPRFMAKPGFGLTEVPEANEWTKNLEKVSLQKNNIIDIASNMFPNCPKLSSLDFSWNYHLRQIPYSFFVHMIGLTFLDLSGTTIEALPDSISILENLIALCLRYCRELRYVPSLAKLKALKKLDLKEAGIVKVPQGMEMLVNLQHLNLYCLNLVELPMEILCNLTHLQFLAAILKPASFALKAENLIRLKMLETFIGQFDDLQGLNDFVKSCHQHQKFNRYWLKVGVTGCIDDLFEPFEEMTLGEFEMGGDYIKFPTGVECTKIIALGEVEIGRDDSVLVLDDFQLLRIENCWMVKSLSETSLFKTATDLRYCEIHGCRGLEFMHHMFSSASICSPFDKLEIICLNDLPNLHALVNVEAEAALAPSTLQTPTPSSIFSNLKIFEISKCLRVKKLFPFELLRGLQNLEKIGVEDCQKVEEIIEVKDEKGTQGSNDTITFTLPKLRKLTLVRLPKMKSICTARGVMVCDSLQTIEINDCPKLRRIPLYLPMLPNGKLSPPPSLQGIYLDLEEMLELLVWDDPSAKDIFLPFLQLSGDATTLQKLFHDLEDFNSFLKSFPDRILSGYELRVEGTNKDDDDDDEDDDDDDAEEEEEEEDYKEEVEEEDYDDVNYAHFFNDDDVDDDDDDNDDDNDYVDCVSFFKTVTFSGLEISEDYHVMLPNDLKLLRIRKCSGVKSLDKTFFIKDIFYLSPFNSLSALTLVKLPNLRELVKVEVRTVSAPSTSRAPTPSSIFPLLKVLKIYECPRIQKLFPFELLKNLQHLQQIYVVDCAEMEEIIAVEEEEEALMPNGENKTITLVLPKLRRLELVGLPKLKSICSARRVMVCDCLRIVGIFECPTLNRIPLYLPLLPNGDLSPPPSLPNFYVESREWWESLVWDNPSAKDILLPFLKLIETRCGGEN